MSTAEAACYSTPNSQDCIEPLPFEHIPHQSRLFLDYLTDPIALRKFYSSAVRYHHELAQRVPEVLSAYRVDRNKVCDALAAMNRRWGAGEGYAKEYRVAARIGLHRSCFRPAGGFVYRTTLHDLQSALRGETCRLPATKETKAVPVFWIAAEDHDFAEVAAESSSVRDCQLKNVEVSANRREGQPVGQVVLDESIGVVDQLFELLPNSEFADDMKQLVKNAWQPGRGYVDSLRDDDWLLGRYGLIFLDPLDPELKKLAAPLYSEAARRAPEIAAID